MPDLPASLDGFELLTVEIPGDPVPKGSYVCMNGHVVPANAKRLREWTKGAREAARAVKGDLPPLDVPLAITVLASFRWPSSRYAWMVPASGLDCDKVGRAVCDALQGETKSVQRNRKKIKITIPGLISDDARIFDLRVIEQFAAEPSVKIWIYPHPEMRR